MFIDHYTISKRFWDGTNKSEDILSFDKKGIKEAINRAIGDLMERTLKRKADSQGDRDEEICNALLPKIEEWFNPNTKISESEFDNWHHKACTVVLNVLQKFYTNNDNQRTPVQYGKAQKIVNMTMKGIYCLKGADDYEKYFEFCHMALDSFTLEWFKRYIATQWFNANHKKRDIKIKISEDDGHPFPRWSNLNFKEGSMSETYESYETNPDCRTYEGKYHYMFFVHTIRKYFKYLNEDKPSRLTPLQAEFFIWEEMQIHIAMENLYSLGGKEKDFKKKSICEKIPVLQAFLAELKSSFAYN